MADDRVGPLRVLTLNTAKGDGDYRSRIAWLSHELAAMRPDIVALQEVFRDESGALDTAAQLQKRLGMNGFWAPARFKPRVCEGVSVPSWSGLALLSRRDWSIVDTLELPSDERDGDRIAQFGYIETERTGLIVANIHLTHLRDRSDLRHEQLRRVLGHPLMQISGAVRLVCGDFNATPDSDVFDGLLGWSSFGHLTDSYELGGGAARRGSLPSHEGRRVDYVLSLADFESDHPVFISSAVVLDRPDPKSGTLPSDHYGVATTMVPLRSGSWRKREDGKLVV